VAAFDQVRAHQEHHRSIVELDFLDPAFDYLAQDSEVSSYGSVSSVHDDDDHVSDWLPLSDGEATNSETMMVDTNCDTSERDSESYFTDNNLVFSQVSEGFENFASSNENREFESTSEPVVLDPTNQASLGIGSPTTFDEVVVCHPPPATPSIRVRTHRASASDPLRHCRHHRPRSKATLRLRCSNYAPQEQEPAIDQHSGRTGRTYHSFIILHTHFLRR
jgi:hypothetical protein